MIRLIIFDIGGVIINFSEEDYIRYLAEKKNLKYRAFRNTMMPLIERMELGRLHLPELESIISKKFKIPKSGLEWDTEYEKVATLNKRVKGLIERLRMRYKVVLLTNVSVSRQDLVERMYLKDLMVNKIFASCYLGMRKPDKRIYKHVLSAMHVKPGETIFVDNMLENVIGARKVGIKSIQFKNYRQLLKAFRGLGVV